MWDDTDEFGVEYVEYAVEDLPFSSVHEVTEDGKLAFYNDWFSRPGSPTYEAADGPDTDSSDSRRT